MSYGESDKNVFNMDLANLEYLLNQIKLINAYLFQGDYNSAYRQIRILKTSLSPEINKKNVKETIEKLITTISEDLTKYQGRNLPQEKKKLGDELFHGLDKLMGILLGVMSDKDMLGTKKEDAAHAMLR